MNTNLAKQSEIHNLEPLAVMMGGAMDALTDMKKTSYYIDEAINKGEHLEVKFCIDGDESLPDEEINWMRCNIDMDTLREYVEYYGMNEVVKDYMQGGEYIQETFVMDFDHYMEDRENREHAAAEYLRDGEPTI